MSTIIMAACWPLQGMSPAQKAVLISLADQANDDGVCWPGLSTISKRTCLSERAVRDALRWLQSAGILGCDFRYNKSTSYTIKPAAYRPQSARPGGKRAASRDAAPPADAAPPEGHLPPPNRKGTINEPSVVESACARNTKPGRPDDVTEQTWNDFAEQRKASKAPLTATALEGIRREAGKAGISLEAALQVCCEAGVDMEMDLNALQSIFSPFGHHSIQ